jgi:hypothetical protein
MKFGLTDKEWTGPFACKFEYFSGHSKTARYRYNIKNRVFDFYAPLFMLRGLGDDNTPEHLQVAIWKSERPVRTCGYLSEPAPLLVESDVLEYMFSEEKANSKRYDMLHEGQVYALYIPNVLFGVQGL